MIVVSFLVYTAVNLFENLIYYNIGRVSNLNNNNFEMPERKDWIKILIVMFVFAFLQGLLTFAFNRQIR